MARKKGSPPKRDNRTRGKTHVKSKIVNWPEYNAALVRRGSLSVWVDEDLAASWRAPRAASVGAPREYSDVAIETLLGLRLVYGLTLRAVVGFAASVFELMRLDLKLPDYTTLCRRGKKVEIDLEPTLGRLGGSPLVVALDATGLKVYGEGEWKVRQHGVGKRRTWRKLHLALDVKTRLITAAVVTEGGTADADEAAGLLKATAAGGRRIGKGVGDGGYDKRKVYEALARHGAGATMPPQRNAKIWERKRAGREPHARDANLREVRRVGRAKWKRESGYHQRSLAENAIGRYKTMIGPRLRSRTKASQRGEGRLGVKLLNKMTNVGMPRRERTA